MAELDNSKLVEDMAWAAVYKGLLYEFILSVENKMEDVAGPAIGPEVISIAEFGLTIRLL
ncbi:hypothetical protein EYZ11_005426 [Aspergillus tanneri]|uniref:Uncharacterized protein n=1 Tax=Aspergillus tanneri TaxID=1220188 RepID=A0A4S3JIC8_9EURO|nr:hypothetical protein EYZ11_005426 [Aspergillus tanneri]